MSFPLPMGAGCAEARFSGHEKFIQESVFFTFLKWPQTLGALHSALTRRFDFFLTSLLQSIGKQESDPDHHLDPAFLQFRQYLLVPMTTKHQYLPTIQLCLFKASAHQTQQKGCGWLRPIPALSYLSLMPSPTSSCAWLSWYRLWSMMENTGQSRPTTFS